MRPVVIFLTWLLLLPLVLSCQQNTSSNKMKDKTSYAGKVKAVDFPEGAVWLNTDRPLKMEELRGKIVLLDFWTYCCINCLHILPDLKRLEKEYPQLVVIGVHSAKFQNEKDVENIRQAILRYDIEHPVIADNDFYLWKRYAIRAWPSFALIDPSGKHVGNSSGEGVYDFIKPYLDGLSEEFAATLDTTPPKFHLERAHTAKGLLSFPGKIEPDATQNRLFVTDANHNRVLVINPEGQVRDVIGTGAEGPADGAFDACTFFRPQGLAYDAVRDVLYIADTENHTIRKADFKARTVTTLVGTGRQSQTHGARADGRKDAINSPWDLTLNDGKLYIAMAGPHQLWVMDPTTNIAEVYAGTGREDIIDGERRAAALAQPSGVHFSKGVLYFADSETSALRKVQDNQVKTLIGEGLFDFGDVDGKYPEARLQHCLGVYAHEGRIYVADTYNHKIKVYDPASGKLTSLLGTGKRGYKDGPAAQAQFNEPNDIVFLNGKFYIADTNNDLIRVYDPKTGEVTTFALKDLARLSMMQIRRAGLKEAPFWSADVQLPAQTVGSTAPDLALTVVLPEGYHLNAEAPNYAEVVGGEGMEPAAITLQDARKLVIKADKAAAVEGVLRVRCGVYFCAEGRAGKCLIKELNLAIPLTTAAGGAAIVETTYELPAAEVN